MGSIEKKERGVLTTSAKCGEAEVKVAIGIRVLSRLRGDVGLLGNHSGSVGGGEAGFISAGGSGAS